MKTCNQCGATLDDNTMFCGNCGNNVASQTVNDNTNNNSNMNNNNNINMNTNYSQNMMNNGSGFINASNNKMPMQQMPNNNWSGMNNNQGQKPNKVLMWSLIGGGAVLLLGIIIFAVCFLRKESSNMDDFGGSRIHGKTLEFDPFDGLEVTFSGTSPEARVNIEYKGEVTGVRDYHYSVDKENNLKKGDEITVTFDENSFHSYDYDEVKVTQKEKKYTCDKVDANVSDFSEIPKTSLDKIKTDVETKISVYRSENSDKMNFGDPKYEGAYFLYKREDKMNDYGTYNKMYVVYSCKLSAEGLSARTLYLAYSVNDIILKADGSVEYRLSNYGNAPEGSTSIRENGVYAYVHGYTDFDKMCKELLDGNKDKYNYKANDGIKEYKG